MRVGEILETCLYVNDLGAAEAFYCDVLGLQLVSRQPARHVFLRCGQRMLLLFDPRASGQPGSDLPCHGAQGPMHVAFAVAARDIDRWQTELETRGVKIEHVVEWPQGGRSLYFRDPDGNSVEVASPVIWRIDEQRCMPELE